MVPIGHTRTCLSLVQGCRSEQRLCGKTGFGDKPSHLNMCYLHDFLINIYCGKECAALCFWATLLLVVLCVCERVCVCGSAYC
jgi:hypothetical protein